MGGLASGKNAPKSGKNAGASAAGQGNQHKSGASGAAIQSYIGQVQGAIQSKFYDSDNYAGKTCDVNIKLAPDGLLISATAAGGDPALCQAAITAAKMAHIPKPPSQEVWQAVRDATLEFKP
ncbi:cell envelope integrity inner membrane protein TolA [Tatumella ptyseos]|uniref:Cell envelope integrity inner membrane protein TolA n=1 Tax=Tatumella ptyseos TaxID=82987 RepID=A0A2X5PBB1_9GAMM|nr:cell envelope integrity inner membrane protein TolA [Tatumella ptyseos]